MLIDVGMCALTTTLFAAWFWGVRMYTSFPGFKSKISKSVEDKMLFTIFEPTFFFWHRRRVDDYFWVDGATRETVNAPREDVDTMARTGKYTCMMTVVGASVCVVNIKHERLVSASVMFTFWKINKKTRLHFKALVG